MGSFRERAAPSAARGDADVAGRQRRRRAASAQGEGNGDDRRRRDNARVAISQPGTSSPRRRSPRARSWSSTAARSAPRSVRSSPANTCTRTTSRAISCRSPRWRNEDPDQRTDQPAARRALRKSALEHAHACIASRAAAPPSLPRARSAIWCRQLVPSATISVSGAGGAHRRQQRELRHPHRHVVVRGLVAEAAGHAAAARFDHLDREARARAPARACVGRHRIERLLMAVPVQQRALLRQRAQARAPAVPRACSRARNSSISSALSAQARCASSPRPITRNSSRIESRHDGSSPTIAAPRATCGRERGDDAPRFAPSPRRPGPRRDTCGRSTAAATARIGAAASRDLRRDSPRRAARRRAARAFSGSK